MKIFTFLLSLCGASVFYLFYADWIDNALEGIAEDYLGFDYEEVAPFIPSEEVSSITKEFDSIVEEFSRKPRKEFGRSYLIAILFAAATVLLFLTRSGKCLHLFKNGRFIFNSDLSLNRNLIQNEEKLMGGISGMKPNERLKWLLGGREEPIQVIWKGNKLMESSVHCNLKDKVHGDGKTRRNGFGAGDITEQLNKESTVRKFAEMRKLLESEQEMASMFVDKEENSESGMMESRPENFEICLSNSIRSMKRNSNTLEEEKKTQKRLSSKSLMEEQRIGEEKDLIGDQQLMNRIRLLESRLRLEELKNRNWVDRMSRAEGILQQLNKQVERIERSQPVETTLLETLKITSTVTKWKPMMQPRGNLQLGFLKECQQQQQQCESLSEFIRREISLPFPLPETRRFMSLTNPPLMRALPPAGQTHNSFILSKFLSK